jgi:hypothetical protein
MIRQVGSRTGARGAFELPRWRAFLLIRVSPWHVPVNGETIDNGCQGVSVCSTENAFSYVTTQCEYNAGRASWAQRRLAKG